MAPVVQKVSNAIHGINLHPMHSAIGFPSTHPLDSHLSSGKRYPAYEQLPRYVQDRRSTESEANRLLSQDETCLVPVQLMNNYLGPGPLKVRQTDCRPMIKSIKACSVPVRNRMTIRFLMNAKTYFRTFFFHNLTRDAPIWLLKARECNLSIDHIYDVWWQTITTPQFTITIVQSQYGCDFVLTAVIMLP